jgi:hypothetical protein
VDGKTEDLLQDLSGEAVFDSQGEFQVDLARAREKLEQHLGLWPEDYLAFLIQAAFALGATQLRLSTRWRQVIWQFDGPTLTRPQLETLLAEDRSQGVTPPLQRLQMAFFLLSKSRYREFTFSSGLAGTGFRIHSKAGKTHLKECACRDSWANTLELAIPLKHISIHWLVSRTTALSTLPEYASVRPRFKDGPLRLLLPWEQTRAQLEDSVPLVISIQGRQRMALESPLPAVHEFRVESDIDYSLWFATRSPSSLRCLVYSLGYTGPDWDYGAVWLYCDGLHTDLSQRQLVVGPRLQSLLADAERRLGEALGQALALPQVRRDCMPWILNSLTHWVGSGGVIGTALAKIPLFSMAFHPDHSLAELDALYQQRQVLYFCTEVPQIHPEEAPPVVQLRPEIATILRTRFSELKPYHEYFALLQLRQTHRQQWSMRKPESLDLNGVVHLLPLPNSWQGQMGLLSSDVPPRLDVFKEGKWLASVSLWQRFPKGLVGRVQHPDLEVNFNWSEPTGPLWTSFLNELWSRMPNWLAHLVSHHDEPWLRDRAYDLMLAHPDSTPLEDLELVPVGQCRFSLQEFRQALADQSLPHWILAGWAPRDRGWRLLSKLIVQDDELRHWKTRLEIYQRGYERWKVSFPHTVSLPKFPVLVCTAILPGQRGEIGLRDLQTQTVQVIGYREGRRLGSTTVSAAPLALGGLPEGLVVAIDHPGLLPNGDWTEVVLDGAAWKEALSDIGKRVGDLLQALMDSDHPDKIMLALRLLSWIPSHLWPGLSLQGQFCQTLEGDSISLAGAMAALNSGPPVRVLIEAGPVHCFPGFESVWLLSHELNCQVSSLWGPSRLHDVQSDYLAAWMTAEHGQRQVEVAELRPGNWLRTETWEHGQVGLCLQAGPANRCHLRLLRQGHLLMEHAWPLCAGPEHNSTYRMEAVIDWPEAPVVTEFQGLWENPDSRAWLQHLHDQLRQFGFSPPPAEREFLWERLAYEAGARESGNVGFTLELDRVKLGLLKTPLFPIEGKSWSLEEVYQHVRAEGRLGYVLGEPLSVGAGPILYVNSRELHWLKLMLGHSQLANLSHLRSALKARQQVLQSPRLNELPLPELDYLVVHHQPERRWGLLRDLNAPSRVRVLRHMRVVETLSFDWRYQVQASLNLDSLQLNQDGSIRRDQLFQKAIDDLKSEIQQAILEETTPGYRLELALWSWGVQEEWAERLQTQPLLRDPRGYDVSLLQWIEAWQLDEMKLPYLLDDNGWVEQLDLLPSRPIPLLSSVLVPAAARMLRGLVNYNEGLKLAWQFSHQSPAQPPPLASYQWENGPLRVTAGHYWVEQQLLVRWRGRVVSRETRQQWPGYLLEVDWSERLLGGAWPDWDDFPSALNPYWRYLNRLLQQPDLLDQDLESWEALPVEAVAGPVPLFLDPGENDLRLILSRRKAEWRQRARGHLAPIQVVCEHWWGCPVEVEMEDGPCPWSLRVVEGSQARRLYINPQNRWFQGQSPEVMAVRICYWLQSKSPGRESLERRNRILQSLGFLENSG